MKGILLLVLALLSILGIEAQWLNSNSNNQHTYNVPSANPLNAAPSKRWTLDPSALRVEHFDEPLYTNDSLLLIAGFNKTGSTYSHYLFGIDSSNGGVGWSSFMFSSEKGGLRPKYLGNGRIYTTIDSTPSAKIGCFDATSGQRLWVSPPLNVTSCVKSMIPVTDILESDDGSTVYAISGCVVDAYSTAVCVGLLMVVHLHFLH
jgi:outer membrane protein assembly factor BamB